MIVRQMFYWSLPVLTGVGLLLEYFHMPFVHGFLDDFCYLCTYRPL
jgi:hypothetical protein